MTLRRDDLDGSVGAYFRALQRHRPCTPRTRCPWFPASLTKLMTAYVTFHALKAGTVSPDTKVAWSEKAITVVAAALPISPSNARG
jgi:CubicO group peptidase (beta-lactamase class C family)